MILRYEFKKIFNKKINKVLFCIVLLITLVFSIFAIYSFEFVDKEGNTHTGVFAARELVKDKNQWVGELTPKVINKVVTKKKILLKHGDMLSPLYFRRNNPRPVSYYALFKGWLLLSQPPGCPGIVTSLPTQIGRASCRERV